MKDYITKLAEHALGAQPSAQPVIPSLYAQGLLMTNSTMNEMADDSTWRESDVVADEPRVADQQPRRTPETIARPLPRNDDPPRQNQWQMRDVMRSLFDAAPPRPASRDDAQASRLDDAQASSLNDAQQSNRGDVQQLPARDTVRATVKPKQVESLPTTARPASAASTIRPRESATSADHSESASTHTRDEQSSNESSDEARQRHDDQPRRTTRDQAATQRSRPVTTRVRPAVAEPHVPKSITAQAQPPLASPDNQSVSNQSPALPPTIRITIGRIEVRAIVPPAPPAKPRTTHAPKLPLDEYLRSRNGGRR
jgi:hypothetical protein